MGDPFDLIIDIGGNRSVGRLRSALRPEGRLVIVGGEGGGPMLGGIQRNFWASIANRFTRRELGWFFSRTTSQGCAQLAEEISTRTIVPSIDRIVGLAEASRALTAMQRGELRGQAVICP